MNLIITERCDKACSFCFAREKNQAGREMSFADFSRLLDFIQASKPMPHFKLLGGEPTVHPQFVQFVQEIMRRGLKFTLITNGLYADTQVRQTISEALHVGALTDILINSSELKDEPRLPAFIQNYTEYHAFARKSEKFHISCAITLSRSRSVEDEVAYVQWLVAKIPVTHLRVSLDYDGNNIEDMSFLNNKTYGRKILAILDVCLAHRIVMNGDCKFYPCMFDDDFQVREQLPHFIKKLRFSCSPNTMPFDIFPDLSYIHCYPAHELGGKNILSFKDYHEARRELTFRKHVLSYQKKVPEVCTSCSYFKQHRCDSLCLGCLKLEGVLTLTP